MDQREVSWATSCQKRDIPGLLDAGKEFRAILDQEDAMVNGRGCKFLDVAIRKVALDDNAGRTGNFPVLTASGRRERNRLYNSVSSRNSCGSEV
jgi:hypothetical protein